MSFRIHRALSAEPMQGIEEHDTDPEPSMCTPTSGAGRKDDFLRMRWKENFSPASDPDHSREHLMDDLLSAEKTLRQSHGPSSSPYAGANAASPYGGAAAGNSTPFLDASSMLESPLNANPGLRGNPFALCCMKQQLTEAEIEGGVGVFVKRPSSSGFGSFKSVRPLPNLTIDVDSAMGEAQKENRHIQPGTVVCSPHDFDMTPGVLLWGNPNEGVPGEPGVPLRLSSSRSQSPTSRGSLSPPLRPFQQKGNGAENVRVYTPTPENDVNDEDAFIRTPPLSHHGWDIAAAAVNAEGDDVEMCGTPVSQVRSADAFESFRPPSGGGLHKARPTQKIVRSASLFAAKDYTDLLRPERRPSQLLYDYHYECIQLEGRGDFGEVWLALHHESRQKFALKRSTQTFRGTRDRQHFLRELNAMHQIMTSSKNHPNIVRYERAWQDKGYFFIVMEYCDEGTLRGYLDYNAQNNEIIELVNIQHISRGLITGLACIHNANFLHLDLKPDNLFLSKEHGVKIGDFGLVVENGEWEDEEGDKRYLAPELLQGRADFKADIFSAGLIVYQMLMNLQDLPGNGPEWHRLRQTPPTQIAVPITTPEYADIAQVVTWMIHPDPDFRPSAASMIAEGQGGQGEH